MTQNQSNQLVKNPNTKKAVAALQKFAVLEQQYKTAKKESEEAAEFIKNAMIEQDIPKIEIDMPGLTGYITLAERVGYKASDIADVPPKFTKKTLDAAKVKAHATLTGELPKGVEETRTQYITKKFKVEQ